MKSAVTLILISAILGTFYYAFPRTIVKETVVQKPVYVEKVVEKPVIKERIVEKPVVKYVDRVVEKPVVKYVDPAPQPSSQPRFEPGGCCSPSVPNAKSINAWNPADPRQPRSGTVSPRRY